MSMVTPPSVVMPFGLNAVDPADINDIPVDSQVAITVGRASYEDGFPPATMADPETAGGVPPFGQDFNGILYALSAHVAWKVGGLNYFFNADVVTYRGGYSQGATILNVLSPHEYFVSLLDNNVDNPNVTPDDWVGMCPVGAASTEHQADAPAAGTIDDYAVGVGVAFLDIDTTLGDVVITGFGVGFNGQFLTITNTGPNLLTIMALSVGSIASNRVRLPADMTVTQNGGLTIRRVNAINLWTQA